MAYRHPIKRENDWIAHPLVNVVQAELFSGFPEPKRQPAQFRIDRRSQHFPAGTVYFSIRKRIFLVFFFFLRLKSFVKSRFVNAVSCWQEACCALMVRLRESLNNCSKILWYFGCLHDIFIPAFFASLTLSNTHTHTHSLSLSLTHTHAHTFSLYVSLFKVVVTIPLSHSLTQCQILGNTRKRKNF